MDKHYSHDTTPQAMDLISYLPKHILHDILSKLPEKDAARANVLSKAWKETCSTSPILVFSESRYGIRKKSIDQNDPKKMEDLIKKRNNFINFVDSKLQRFHDQGLAIKQFTLKMEFFDPYTLSPKIDYWMELASESGIEVLHLDLIRTWPKLSHGEYYCLPSNILESKSLVKLILFGCVRIDQAFLNHPIKFSSLEVLSLCHVYVGEEKIIHNLIASCPLIEYITMKYCHELKSVFIHSLPKLKRIEFRGMEEVVVDAPSLEYFHYFESRNNSACKINMDKCKNVRDLCLSLPRNVIITNQWLTELLLKFPLLERLELEDCNLSKKIKISSLQLKVLKFSSSSHFEEACIDAPKLWSCSYDGDEFTMPNVIFSNNLNSLEFNVMLDICFGLDFLKLNQFLWNIKPGNVLASLVLDFCYPTDEFNTNVLQDISIIPPSIKHLHLHLLSNIETLCLPLLIGLLWSCRPAIISIKLNSTLCSRMLIKVLCEMLTGILNEDDCRCNSSHIMKCWWHGQKDVKVTISCVKYENVILDCKSLLNLLPDLSTVGEVINFRLKS